MSKSSGRLVLVTGMSGAGRTTAMRVLEDLGFEAVDNLPLKLLKKLEPQMWMQLEKLCTELKFLT